MVKYAAPIGREVNSPGGERSLSYPDEDTGGLIWVDPVAREFSFVVELGKQDFLHESAWADLGLDLEASFKWRKVD